MEVNNRRIIIYDPFLIDEVGHCAPYDKAIYDELWRQDRPCHAMGRKETALPWVNGLFSDSLQVPFFTVKNLRRMLGKKSTSVASGKVEMPKGGIKREFVKAFIDYFDFLNILYLNIQHFFIGIRFRKVVIFSPNTNQYFAFGLCLSSWVSGSKLILMYRSPFDIPHIVARMFKSVEFVTDCAELTVLLEHKIGRYFEPWPLPWIVPPKGCISARRSQQLTVGVIGTPRLMKGLDTVLRVVTKMEGYKNIDFLIQANLHNASKEEIAIVNRLSWFANVQLIQWDQEETVYRATVAKMDVMLLPYKREQYAYTNSASFLDAIAFEKVPIVTKDTWMSKLIVHPCLTVEEGDVQTICNRIVLLQDSAVYKHYLQHVKNVKEIVFAEHNPKNFVKKLLA
jgi:hypothetical protein